MPAHKRPPPPASPAAAAAEDSAPPPPSTVEQHHTEELTPQPHNQEVKNEAVDTEAANEQKDMVDEPPPPPPKQQQQDVKDEEEKGEEDGEDEEENPQPELPQEQQDDSQGEGGGDGGGSDLDLDDDEEDVAMADDDQLIPVRLADIRKEVQCPICLGIIRKTRTVMECLHRFCRECIDKSMRLGNNECPACRTHCASRRSLRDDSNYDSLISAVYADIDKYEEEELAFREEEKSRNKKIQEAIAETFRRQAEALGRKRHPAKSTAASFARRSHGNYRNSYFRGRGRNYGREAAIAASDDDDDLEANANDGGKESSSADEPSPERRQKRYKRWGAPRSSPARAVSNADIGSAENDDIEVNKETIRTSPLRAGEILAWGKNGTRSQTRHGNIGGSSGRMVKGGRINRLVDHLRNLDQTDKLDVHVVLIPLDDKSILKLQQPYVCCQPTMSIRHICEFIALQTSVHAEEVQLCAKKIQDGTSVDITLSDPPEGQVLDEQETLRSLITSYTSCQGELVLFYNLKIPS